MTADVVFHVVLALAVVVAAGRLLGRAATAIGQPPVIGEVLSGILLGPSLLGLISPAAQAYLFPDTVRPALAVVAHLGVLLYMFLVGLEFDTGLLKQRAASLVVTCSEYRGHVRARGDGARCREAGPEAVDTVSVL